MATDVVWVPVIRWQGRDCEPCAVAVPASEVLREAARFSGYGGALNYARVVAEQYAETIGATVGAFEVEP